MQTVEAPHSVVPSSIHDAAVSLISYCRSNNWAGWDPFDGLNSPLFSFRSLQSRWPRLIFIQGFKRSPINFRTLFAVPKEVNPKGLALFSSALMKLASVNIAQDSEARKLLDALIQSKTTGHEHVCWGYNFDWQTRF